MLGVSSVYAHNKKLAKDGCHNMAGVLHHHPVGATKIDGPCERKGKITIKTINRTVEVLGQTTCRSNYQRNQAHKRAKV